ncbi:hypothetical protein ACJX0J_028537, partial [Zea mays]
IVPTMFYTNNADGFSMDYNDTISKYTYYSSFAKDTEDNDALAQMLEKIGADVRGPQHFTNKIIAVEGNKCFSGFHVRLFRNKEHTKMIWGINKSSLQRMEEITWSLIVCIKFVYMGHVDFLWPNTHYKEK